MQPQDLTLLHDDGTPQHVKVYGVTEGFFELFGLPMTLGGFTPEHFVPPPPRPAPKRRRTATGAAGRRDLVSRLAGPLSTAIRRSSASRSSSRNSRRRSPAWRRATSTRRTAATSGSAMPLDPRRRQSLLRRLHAAEARRDARARARPRWRRDRRAGAAIFPPADRTAPTSPSRWSSRSSAISGRS